MTYNRILDKIRHQVLGFFSLLYAFGPDIFGAALFSHFVGFF
jgi:hypothetical protein